MAYKDLRSIAVWDGKMVFAEEVRTGNDDWVWLQDRDNFDDDGSWYGFTLRTGDLRLAGILGYQCVTRVALLGEMKEHNTIRFKMGFEDDAEGTWTDTLELETTTGTLAAGKQYARDFDPAEQVQDVIRVEIEEQEPSTASTEAIWLSGLTVEYEVYDGPARVLGVAPTII